MTSTLTSTSTLTLTLTPTLTPTLTKVDPLRFEAQFGVGTDQAQGLIDAKTLSIAKLMELLPPETLAVTTDPTPFIYDTSWQAIAGLVCVSAVSHNMIRPVDLSKYQKEV